MTIWGIPPATAGSRVAGGVLPLLGNAAPGWVAVEPSRRLAARRSTWTGHPAGPCRVSTTLSGTGTRT